MMYKYVHNTQFSVPHEVQYYLNFVKIIICLRIEKDEKSIYWNVNSSNLLLLELQNCFLHSDCIFYDEYILFSKKKITKID